MSTACEPAVFDLLGPLPPPRSTTVLEASAGTGKTFALAGLVTRYIAEGVATLEDMLLITFSRAATQELRDRVRRQIADACAAFGDRRLVGNDLGDSSVDNPGDNEVIAHLLRGTPEELAVRKERLGDALAGFDAATIATIHQFCNLVLTSLGVAGDADAGVELVESLDELIVETVDDLYLARFGKERDEPPLPYKRALRIAREVVANPSTELRPRDPEPGSYAAACIDFAEAVRAEVELRKRRQGILGYDDLLSRLADALAADGSPARQRMSSRWPIVMVDEFQDTDPVQWQVIDRAFNKSSSGASTLVLIGDPKQAIYSFRGGDIHTYLHAADSAGGKQTMGTNWRSDAALVDRLQAVLSGATLGDPRITVHDVEARHQGTRLAGAPHPDPFRLRVVARTTFGKADDKLVAIDDLRSHIGKDLAADIAAVLASPATFDDKPVQAGDIAVIVEKRKDARVCFAALTAAGIPAVYTGDSDVFDSEACDDWMALLEAFDQPHRSGVIRAAAATMFFGYTAEDLARGGDSLTDSVAEAIREWAGHARACGVAAVFESARLRGMADRVLSRRTGERYLTDVAHVAQLLQEAAHRERLTLPALRDWLRDRRDEPTRGTEHNKRLDRDTAAVQVMTVHGSKGLQFPIVYLPFAFNRYVPQQYDEIVFHDNETRCLHIGGRGSDDYHDAQVLGRREAAGDDSRLMYVALTRAQSQVVAWWAPSRDEPNGGLSRLLRGRRPGESRIPDQCATKTVTDSEALERFREWEAAGGPVVEQSVIAPTADVLPAPTPSDLAVRHFHRGIDTTWRRTSYSGLVRAAQEDIGVSSEPEVTELDDEVPDIAIRTPAAGVDVPSPMAQLPTGAKFGSLVHAVLETTDPLAPDLAAELTAQIEKHSVWWPVDVPAAELATALIPMHDTPLGELAADLTLREIGLRDRLCEMEFEIPLAGGDLRSAVPEIRLADVGRLLADHLPADDLLASYVARLTDAALGSQSLRGYLSGSIDAVLRIRRVDDAAEGRGAGGARQSVPADPKDHCYVVVDYKTNWLGEQRNALTAADYTPARMAEAMLHSDYPLQALLYCVVLHRFLRWREPGYDPDRHLGGVLYLFLRGMCGPHTPRIDGQPAGVFGWQPSAALVTALSDLLDGRRAAG
jgi:exodeoxyribonuclease V beta subunit